MIDEQSFVLQTWTPSESKSPPSPEELTTVVSRGLNLRLRRRRGELLRIPVRPGVIPFS